MSKSDMSIGQKCTVCHNLDTGSPSCIQCETCQGLIHKSCYNNLTGDLLSIFEDYEGRNVKFPIPIICNSCIKSITSVVNKVHQHQNFGPQIRDPDSYKVHQSSGSQKKNPFEVDNVTEVILGYLSIKELISARLINTCCNKNAVRILQKPASQSKMKPIKILNDIEHFEETIKNSSNLKIFRTLHLDGISNQTKEKVLEVLTNLKPFEVKFHFDGANYRLQMYFEFIVRILVNISQNVRRIKVKGIISWEEFKFFEDIHFPHLNEFILDILSFSPDDEESIGNFIKLCTKNSPKLTNVKIPFLTSDQIFHSDVQLEKLDVSENQLGNLQNISQLHNLDNIRLERFTFSLAIDKHHVDIEDHLRNFANFPIFLQKQSSTLKELHLNIFVKEPFPIESDPLLRLIFPRLKKLTDFKIYINNPLYFENDNELNDWPIQPINFGEICPNLRNVTLIGFQQNWSSFLLDSPTPCKSLKEIIIEIECWDEESRDKIFENFPKIEYFNIANQNDNLQIKNVKFDNFSIWSTTLKTIEIQMSHKELRHFDFENFLYMPNLEEIILQSADLSDKKKFLIKPNFSPLLSLKKLSTFTLRGFKICENIVNELKESNLNFSFDFS